MSWRTELDRAYQDFRRAQSHLDRAGELIDRQRAALPAPDATAPAQAELAALLTQAARRLAPGYLSEPLETVPADTPMRGHPASGTVHVRVGTAEPVPGVEFPVVVPLLGAGHLVVDGDAADPRVAGLLRSVLLRSVAAVPRLSIRLVDGVTLGQAFTSAAPLVAERITEPTATDGAGLERVLDLAEAHVHEVQRGRNDGVAAADLPLSLVIVAGLPPQTSRAVRARIAALAHAGPLGRLHLVLAGWRDDRHEPAPAIEHAAYLTVGDDHGHRLTRLPVPLRLDPAPPPQVEKRVFGSLTTAYRRETSIDVADLMPEDHWRESSVTGLSTVVGRDARGAVELRLDDATPHWLIGGRTGGGKTVFLLGVLYGLAARYGPRELALYLLDFKEGVSFTEFTPSDRDPSWIPQVRAVGVESDREYGNAVLLALRGELTRRASAMKRAGVTKLADLRRHSPDRSLPRIVAVVDEFHVLFAGNDRLAREAAGHLEELARKGRSYGIHLILASQTISGVEALYTKRDSIFGQFPMRIALPGARHVLDHLNTAAETIRLGQAVVNDGGGVTGFDRLIQFPDVTADGERLAGLRHALWRLRDPDSAPPNVFAGYAEQHLVEDPRFPSLAPAPGPGRALLGRGVDTDISTVSVALDPVPGRNLAVLGTDPAGADVLHAAVVGLGRQHAPGRAVFLLVPLIGPASDVCRDAADALVAAGHKPEVVNASDLADRLTDLVEFRPQPGPVYLTVFGGDAAGPVWGTAGQKAFQRLLRHGPAHGYHLLGWWRGLRRFIDDIGGGPAREDVACLLALNVPGGELGAFIGNAALEYQPRQNRALLIDRHDNTTKLTVPFRRPDRADEEPAW
ncbi:FtsK/SpoIIIE family protein [Stackebrandtia albiflava]|uniref:FtsK/SpoIIIE family protein n=1 Tax=Stackebrandtia albiflava TaxID=406432 RepID=A0A562VHB5_9ACTN|nr:FtsK/SpoIIIE domain-containing protein [Stackebrandtia albiflava]TWJ17157.1 FtsK/SpoIIIE family protein [Stackebrandtia albiflava]